MDREISAHLIRLRATHPFLATISLFARYQFDEKEPKFTTDGRTIKINPDYYKPLAKDEKTGLLVHLTLHTALQHTKRRGPREESIWNTAADIVVNNIILETERFKPPKETAIEPRYRDQSVEQIYELLTKLPNQSCELRQALENAQQSDSRDNSSVQENREAQEQDRSEPSSCDKHQKLASMIDRLYPCHKDIDSNGKDGKADPASEAAQKEYEQYWKSVFRRAEVIHKISDKSQGDIPQGLLLEIDALLNPELDWRWLLWNYVVRTPADFEGFDRRFVHRGLYIDHLETDKLNVAVAIDTSGSIDIDELTVFISELQGIVSAYHFIKIRLYYVDAEVYGPHELDNPEFDLAPMGGGGTDFVVFFNHLQQEKQQIPPDLVVYFTDGFGVFPETRPLVETLWVVCAAGLPSNDFPFGRVARLLI
ncbi:MAG: VWA-like domain-containing protein [Candidatus Thiodiazotropha sp.]